MSLVKNFIFLAAVLFSTHSVGQSPQTLTREIELEWEAVEAASKYQIKISPLPSPNGETSQQAQKARSEKIEETEAPQWKGSLTPGRYTMELRSFDDRGVPGDWSEPSEFAVKLPQIKSIYPKTASKIISDQAENMSIDFKWEPLSGAPGYLVQVKTADQKIIKSAKTSESHLSINLPVAQHYKWSVQILNEDQLPTDETSPSSSFTLVGQRLSPPVINKPLSQYVLELSWEKPPYSESYNLSLQRRTTKGWKEVRKLIQFKNNKIPFDLSQPSGTYKLKAQARATLRQSSPVAEQIFEARGGILDPSALEDAKLKDSLNKPTRYYFIASYLLTQVSYEGEDHELNSGASFQAIGGTGRLGLGYHVADQSWGLFGIIDLSGFDLDGDRYTFSASEIHGTWQSYFGKNQILLGGGAFLKELPDLRGNFLNGFSGLGKVRSFGPHLGGQIWRPLSERLGIQLHARVYFTALGSAPNGEKVASSLSYQAGLLGTYKLSAKIMGYAGYVFRVDNALYEAKPFGPDNLNSFANSGDLNSIILQGHYLNLVLDYSF